MTVRGACPGLFRPMPTGDGLLVRLRPPAGRLSSAAAEAIATLAATHGNGAIDLGRRGGLQLRGLTAAGVAAVIAGLMPFGLVDADAAGEAVRNVVASPLSDLDPAACLDAAALARQLEAALTAGNFADLPAKFGFAVDDGGAFPLGAIADVGLIGTPAGVVVTLAGAAVARVPPGQAVAAALALAHAFLRLAPRLDPPPRRLAALIAALGPDPVLAAAGLTPITLNLPPRVLDRAALLGRHAGRLGVAAPFGRLTAAQMSTLAEAAPAGLRLTPWALVVVPGSDAVDRFAAAGLIVDAADPRLFVAACPGAPGCAAASVATRPLAEQLARLRPAATSGAWLHVSGCAKGCASSAAHAVTVVGRAGLYDVVAHGRADDKAIRQGLTAEAVVQALAAGGFAP